MRYAVFGGAQRIRPILSVRIAEMLDCFSPHTLRAAASVELLHCASLIVDDLPCMDNEQMRRGQPCVHIAFGEATAVLAAFGLVSLAARSLVSAECPPREMERLLGFQRRLLAALDCDGLIAGQMLDLAAMSRGAETQTANERLAVTDLKTVPLFMLAARAGALFAPGDAPSEGRLIGFGREFGIAFQMADDYLDGDLKDIEELRAQLERTRACLTPIGPAAAPLHGLLDYLNARAWKKDSSHR